MHTIRATILQTPTPHELAVLPDHLVTVDGTGRIASVAPATSGDVADESLGDRVVLVPGMIDCHLHAPQWPQLGTALDRPLDQWLFDHTFPLESRFGDTDLAVRVWDDMVPTLLSLGTTTVAYYSSIHLEATTALAEACVRHGQRAFVGRVAMDHPSGTPDWYRDPSATESVALSAASIEAIRALDDPARLVAPIVTPRFIPACSDEALTGLAELAVAAGTTIQTHCSEGDWEHGHVLERCGVTDSHALDAVGLMRDHTVLAHATHLDDADRSLIARRGSGVAHCPLSNAYFSQRAFAARSAIEAGVRVGLGTDVAGGPSPSLFAQCGHAITAGRRRSDRDGPGARIDTIAAFWMATAGGADLLGIDAGLLETGRHFDALAIRVPHVAEAEAGWNARFERLVQLAHPADIERVWVGGRQVV